MTIEFHGCDEPSVGLELELQLLDAGTLDLIDGIVPLIELYPDRTFVKPEFFQSCVEVSSPACGSTLEARRHVLETLAGLMRNCADLGMTLSAAGTHAFDQRLALITPIQRFLNMQSTYGHMALTQLTFATHVHVGMPTGNTAIFVMRHLTPCLPALLAAAANSPYWRGYETGYAAYRTCILAATEHYGLPEYFDDWDQFVGFYQAAVRAGVWQQFKDIHWDLRPRPDFGTLEVRIMDATSSVTDAIALTAFVRCLMVYFIEHVSQELDPGLPVPLMHWLEHINRYRASHYGLEADHIDDANGETRPLRRLVEHLVELIQPVAVRLGEEQGIADFQSMLDRATGYERQRALFDETKSLLEVTRILSEDLRAEVQSAGDHSAEPQRPGAIGSNAL